MKIKVDIMCCLCGESHETEVDIPGWAVRYGWISEETAFCPTHAKVEEWCEDVCPGCVGGFMDCGFCSAFTESTSVLPYTDIKPLTDEELEIVRSGRCPRRVNGTMVVNRSPDGVNTESLDLSEQASTESGNALADAIIAYRKKYGTGGVEKEDE